MGSYLSRFRSALVPALSEKWFDEPWGLAGGRTAFRLLIRRIGSSDYAAKLEELGLGGMGSAMKKAAARAAVEQILASGGGETQEAKPGFRRAKKPTRAQSTAKGSDYQERLREAIAPIVEEQLASIGDKSEAHFPALALLVAGWEGDGLPELSPEAVIEVLLSGGEDGYILPAELPHPHAGKYLVEPIGSGGDSAFLDHAQLNRYAEDQDCTVVLDAETGVPYMVSKRDGSGDVAHVTLQEQTVEVPYGGRPLHLAVAEFIMDKAEQVEYDYHRGIEGAEGN